MTLPIGSRVTYTGTGSSYGPFSYPFKIFAATDLRLTKRPVSGAETTLVYPTDYSVSGVLDATGTVLLTTALANLEVLTIRRAPALTQGTSIRNQGTYYPAVIEDEFDQILAQIQSLQDQLDRAPKLRETYDPAAFSMTNLIPTPNQVLAWNSTATGIESRAVSDSATVLPGGRLVTSLSTYLANNAVYNVLDWLAMGNGKTVNDGAITNATAILTSATAGFTALDVGKGITVLGAGAAGVRLVTTILSYQSATQVTLAANAGTTVTNATIVWGTDDYTAIAATAAAIPATGGVLLLPEATYYIHGIVGILITGKSNIAIRGPGLIYAPNVQASTYILQVSGSSSGVSTTVTGAITKNDGTITVANGALFTPGQMAMMTSTEGWSVTDAQYKKGELIFIKSIAGNVLTLTQGAKDTYATGGQTITVTRLNRIDNILIDDIEVRGGGGNTHQYGIGVAYGTNVRLRNVKVTDAEDVGVAFQWGDNNVALTCSVLNCNGAPAGAVPGYAFNFDNMTQNSEIEDCYAENFRHAFTTGSIYPCWNWSVSVCRFAKGVGAGAGGIISHVNGAYGVATGNTIINATIGIEFDGPGCHASGNIISLMTTVGLYALGDGTIDCNFENNNVRYCRSGVFVDPLAVTNPDTTIVGNKLIGDPVGGTVSTGISSTADNTKIRSNEVRLFSPGITVQKNNCTIQGNEIVDVRTGAGQAYGILVTPATTITGTKILGNRLWASITSQMTDGIVIANSSVSDTVIEGNHIDNWSNSPINDAGTRTRTKRNWINGVRQRVAVLGNTLAGSTNATLAGRVKTVNALVAEINGLKYNFAAADPYWNVTGVTTTAGQFRKVLLCIATNAVGAFYVGRTAATQAAAEIPDWCPYNQIPVAMVEIPNSYTDGGSMAGFVFVDFLGQVE